MNEKMIEENKKSYYEQVGPGNTSSVKQYNISGREITKNGYVYIILPGFVNNDGSSKIFSYFVDNGSILQNFKFLSRLYYEVLSFSDAFWMVNKASPYGIPDNISLGISVQNGIPCGNGASISYALNFITHGKDFGFHKTTTVLPNTSGLGFGFAIPEISLYSYNGIGSPTLSSFLGSSGTVSGGLPAFGSSFNYSGNSLSSFHAWEGISSGIGMALGIIYGNGSTYLGWH